MTNPIICFQCIYYHANCPMHGMSNVVDEPLEGSMSSCIYYRSDALIDRKSVEPHG